MANDPREQSRKEFLEGLLAGRFPTGADETVEESDAGQPQASAAPRRNIREQTLRTANTYVNGDRNAQYGDPSQDFLRTATYWQAYIAGIVEREGGALTIRPHDVAAMMALLKLSRISHSPTKHDHWVDLAGYAACGAETVNSTMGGLK